VEIFVKPGAKFRYSSVENWSQDTYNLNTKRAIVEENGIMEWVGGNLGSGRTMLYPCSILKGRGARADHLGVAFANAGQIQDTGAKVMHLAPDTSSTVLSKSISKNGGVNVYRGLLHVAKGATGAKSQVRCDALILDAMSKNDTFPTMRIQEDDVSIGHEASVGRISEEQLFYLQSRGISEEAALAMIVNGFIEPIVKQLPLEYAVEMNRLIEMEMERSIS
jgi:Fe-S cluster assembly protein SufB